MATPLAPAYRLQCSCNEYPWGKQGSQSLAATLCEKGEGWQGENGPQQKFKVDSSKPYAEMWMGTYPELPSYVAGTSENLQDVLDRHPQQLIGDEVISKFGHTKLPYLPKILSISKALPLQVHPNKDLASKLHKQNPEDFTDPNHKPEIALALSDFEAFCGFKPLGEIEALLQIPELKRFTGSANGTVAISDSLVKEVVRNMLSADDETVKNTYNTLVSLPEADMGVAAYIPKLAKRLAEQYDERDPGTLVALVLMNYLKLKAGDGIYIPADGIHAYLAGDIVECMARSNNVLNTGFCPKAERSNVDLFCSTLSFSPHSADESILRAQSFQRSQNGKTVKYAPPMSEFDMLQTELLAGENEVLGALGGPAILIATKGSAEMTVGGENFDLKEGYIYFVAPKQDIKLSAGTEGLLMRKSAHPGKL